MRSVMVQLISEEVLRHNFFELTSKAGKDEKKSAQKTLITVLFLFFLPISRMAEKREKKIFQLTLAFVL